MGLFESGHFTQVLLYGVFGHSELSKDFIAFKNMKQCCHNVDMTCNYQKMLFTPVHVVISPFIIIYHKIDFGFKKTV